jgi:hypothetical protein
MEPQHFSSPFAFNAQGRARTTVQGSPEGNAMRVLNVLVCEEGFREDLPEYGAPSLLFGIVPLELGPFRAAVERWTGIEVTAQELEGLIPADRQIVVGVP